MRHFFLKKKRTYLDWASAAPVSVLAQKAFEAAVSTYGNPSSPHEEGRRAKELLENARIQVARLAAVKPRGVVFTSGATEANALAIQGTVAAARERGSEYAALHVLYLPTMHSSVRSTLEALQKTGVAIEEIPLTNGEINLTELRARIRPETILVCVDAVCGETGTRFDTLRIRRELDACKSRAVLHVDASQLPLIESIEHTRFGADLMVLDAQKVGGVRGVGALVMAKQGTVSPIMYGGGQEAGLRPGTEPAALITAFAEALAVCSRSHREFAKAARATRALLIDRITSTIPEAVINEAKHTAPHILNLSLPGLDTDYAVTLLDRDGFAVSTRSACETDSVEGSKAVLFLTEDEVRATSTLRISWGPETRKSNVLSLVPALREITTFLASF